MHYIRQLYTGVAICDVCGRTWELYRIRAEEAICHCGATLTCVDLEIPKPPAPAKGTE